MFLRRWCCFPELSFHSLKSPPVAKDTRVLKHPRLCGSNAFRYEFVVVASVEERLLGDAALLVKLE